MRYLKKLIFAILVYLAAFMAATLILQAITGYDFTAAYSAVGAIGAVELALGSIIKISENREQKKAEKRGNNEND